MLTINPLLSFSQPPTQPPPNPPSPTQLPPPHYDLLEPADKHAFAKSIPHFSEPAMHPPSSRVVITSRLPWAPVVVQPSRTQFPSQEYVTVLDVLNTLYDYLHTVVSRAEYEKFTSPWDDNKESVVQAFEARVSQPQQSREEGIKRVDYLCGRTRFLGLTVTSNGHTEAHFSYGTLRLGLLVLNEQIARGALFDSAPRCHQGTRGALLDLIESWAEDRLTHRRVLWLYGSAGSGKSAIAGTIAERCRGAAKPAASFFFFRADPGRNTAERLFLTLASQLASAIPEISTHIEDTILKDPLFATRPIKSQFEDLIKQPFREMKETSASQPLSRLIIIDGVDECINETVQQEFLTLIGQAVSNGEVPLRFLICSRPETHIRKTFEGRAFVNNVTFGISLEECPQSHLDIEKYLEDQFDRIAIKHGIDSSSWPSRSDITRLAENSSGHFTYASTVIKFVDVDDNLRHPNDQLKVILGLRSREPSPFADLDRLYIEILARQDDQQFLKEFLGFLVVFLSSSGTFLRQGADSAIFFIRVLLDLPEKELLERLRGFHPLLNISESSAGVHHKSFIEFLQHPARSRQYHVNQPVASRRLLDRLVEVSAQIASRAGQTMFAVSGLQLDLKHSGPCRCEDEDFEALYRISRCLAHISSDHLTSEWWEALRPFRTTQSESLLACDMQRSVGHFDNYASPPAGIVSHTISIFRRCMFYLGL